MIGWLISVHNTGRPFSPNHTGSISEVTFLPAQWSNGWHSMLTADSSQRVVTSNDLWVVNFFTFWSRLWPRNTARPGQRSLCSFVEFWIAYMHFGADRVVRRRTAAVRMSASRRRRRHFRDVFTSCCTPAIRGGPKKVNHHQFFQKSH